MAVRAAVKADVLHHRLAVGPVFVLDHQLHDAVGLVLHLRRPCGVAREGKTADFGEVARDDVVGRPDAAGEDVAVGERADELLVLDVGEVDEFDILVGDDRRPDGVDHEGEAV